MPQTFDETQIIGDQNTTQLLVKGYSTQTNPLQEWQKSDGAALAQLTQEGRLRIGGDLSLSTPSALLEANQDLTSGESIKQGWQSLGKITGALSQAVSWIVHELQLLGTGGVSSVHAVLRSKLTHNNSGNSSSADLRAGDFEAVNQSGTSGTPVGKLTGIKATATNEAGAHLSNAAALKACLLNQSGGNIASASGIEVEAPTNQGTITNLHGLKVANVTQGTNNYAIHTGQGRVHVGDILELKSPASVSGTPASDSAWIYPKSNGHLYAKAASGAEVGLTETLPKLSIYKNANQVITTNVVTRVSFQTVLYSHTLSLVSNELFRPTLEGYYLFTVEVLIDIPAYTATFPGSLRIWKNRLESNPVWTDSWYVTYATGMWPSAMTALVAAQFYANGTSDYFEIWFGHFSGSDKTLLAGSNTFLQITKLP